MLVRSTVDVSSVGVCRQVRLGVLRVATVVAVMLSLTLAVPSRSARAEEPFQQFIDALRERGYFESAMDYLAEMNKSNLVGLEVKSIIPYEEARTLIDDARAEKDTTQKGRKLDAAKVKLDDFVKANSAHIMTPNARMQLGNVIVERGRMQAELATRPSQNAAGKKALNEQARKLFDEALKVFTDAETNFKETLDKFPKFIEPNEAGKKLIEQRDMARRDYIQAMLFAAATAYEKAKTYDEKDKTQTADHKKQLQDAADKYEKIYQNFRTRLAGLLARIKQGQCYQEMGDTRRALGYYADILGQPDDLVEFRRLKASALYLSLQCWITESEKKYELAAVKGDEWLRTGRGSEDRQPDWLAIRYYTGYAHSRIAKQLDPDNKGAGTDGAKAKQHRTAALDHAKRVAGFEGPYQDPAKGLMNELGKDPSGATKDPTTFVEASERGKLEMDAMTTAQVAAKDAQKNSAEASKVPELMKTAGEHRANAQKFFELALSLREKDTEQDEMTNCRYYLCYLHYLSKEYYDAAVMGEFIARNYPSNGGARQAAKIALACYLQEYNNKQAPIEFRAFDAAKMLEIAEYCAKRWPEEEETLDNWNILMAVAIGEHDLVKAAEYIARVPESSPRRADSELKLGQAYWSEYLVATQKEEGEKPSQADLEKLLAEATKWLEQGMARMRAAVDGGGAVTLDLAAAALSASQIYVGSGSPEKAIAMLEDPKFGPLTLVNAKNPIVQQHEIPRETYKVALRAYVAVSQADPKGLEKAEAMMKGLEELAASGGDSASDLTKIYISMGRALEEQVTTLRAAGKVEELSKTTKGFELFLKKIAESEKGNNFASLNWVAETFYSLGAGFDVPGVKLPPEAEGYYKQTLDADKKLLERSAKEKDFSPGPDGITAVRLRTARCLRRLNKYKEAVDLLELILKEKPQLLDAQTEAAFAYMDWGAAENPLYYNLAMAGARKWINPQTKREENVIWGWIKMSNVLMTNPQFEKTYHDARVNTARCHLAQALAATAENKLDKTKLLNDAYQDIRFTTRVRDFRKIEKEQPEIFAKYDEVLKTIQKTRGEKPTGMKGMIEPAPKATTPAAATTTPAAATTTSAAS